MDLLFKPLQRILNNPSLVALLFFSSTLVVTLYFVGKWLIPVIVSIIIAYLLEGLIKRLEQLGIRRIFAVFLVFLSFSLLLAYLLIALVPTLIHQAKELLGNLPTYLSHAQDELHVLPEKFPHYLSEADINGLLNTLNTAITGYTRELLAVKFFASILAVFTFVVYSILIPLLVFFFLKDKAIILRGLARFLPQNNQIIQDIWAEVDVQIGNYIRGKFIEILVIWMLCLLPFNLFGLQYSLLLGLMVGLSVLIPYIGATIVTIPVLVVAYMQFGFAPPFWWIATLYFIIQILDANVIVPLIFSEAVNIHPVALIIAVLIFGGLWGFWGVFFAIPLATLVKAIIEAWQRYEIRGRHEDITAR